MMTHTGEVPEKCEASGDFECENTQKTLKQLGVFYETVFPNSVIPEGKKLWRVCESCHIAYGAGKYLGLRYELQENGLWKQIEEEVDQDEFSETEEKVKNGFFEKVRKYAKKSPLLKMSLPATIVQQIKKFRSL